MRKILLYIWLVLLPVSVVSQQKADFRPPLDIPLVLSGNFGELRTDHFHSGIDFKTQGVSGHKVFAIESGTVSRIKVHPGGYGKALYVDHSNGFTSVYGHLSSYSPAIEKYIKDIQYQRKLHAVDVFPKAGELFVEKGDVIALSGNTGSSSGPHLHFEIRRTADQRPLNGLFFNFPIPDNKPPEISKLVIYPVGDNAHVANSSSPLIIEPTSHGSNYQVNRKETIQVFGKIGFGIEVYDYLDGAWNRCGIYSIELRVDGKQYFYSEMDEFSFAESRFINAHIDYFHKKEKQGTIQRLYKLPYNNLSIYKKMVNEGLVEITDTLLHEVVITTTDSYGNTSRLSFNFQGSGSAQRLMMRKDFDGPVLSYNALSGYSNRNIQLSFPSYCFYEDVPFTFARTNGRHDLFSDLYHLHKESTPVHKSFSIAITPNKIPEKNRDKLCIVKIEEKDEISFAGGTFENGMVSGTLRSFGKYAIAIDTIRPTITALNIYPGKDVTMQSDVRFRISDNLSGIESYNGYIDNQWVLFEYDPKNDLLFYEFDDRFSNTGKNHELEIHLSDPKGNKTVYHTTFYR